MNLEFGDYCLIEQKRYGADNEMYLYKVVRGDMRSNTWVNVPVDSTTVENRELVPVILAICCGVDETKVEKFRVADVKPNTKFKTEEKTRAKFCCKCQHCGKMTAIQKQIKSI